ncbi:MAG: hypothetical protein AAB296_10330, partial [Candidatus Desantisbacteria bacterium]
FRWNMPHLQVWDLDAFALGDGEVVITDHRSPITDHRSPLAPSLHCSQPFHYSSLIHYLPDY